LYLGSASAASTGWVAIGEFPAFRGLIEHLGIQIVEEAPPLSFTLVESDKGIELRPPGETDRPGIRAVFPPDSTPSTSGGRPPLAKAFGKKIKRVLDLTAGLGSDAYRLAAAGYEVRGWERNPAVFALLISGWGVSVASGRVPKEIADRISFEWGDANEAVGEFDGSETGAYFDPMYPAQKRATALPKRPLQVLRGLLESRDEPSDLVTLERERLSRVVVKRPHHAPPIFPDVDFQTETKLVRFDVYLNPARMQAVDP